MTRKALVWLGMSCMVVFALGRGDKTEECIQLGMGIYEPGSEHYEEEKRYIEKRCNASASCASAIVRFTRTSNCQELGKGMAWTCGASQASLDAHCD